MDQIKALLEDRSLRLTILIDRVGLTIIYVRRNYLRVSITNLLVRTMSNNGVMIALLCLTSRLTFRVVRVGIRRTITITERRSILLTRSTILRRLFLSRLERTFLSSLLTLTNR